MDCDAISERLPWLLNGTLEAHEAEELRRHVAGCARCQREMEETRQAAAVFGAHLPAAIILDLAWDREVPEPDGELVRRHLEECAGCREELELARESRALERDPARSTGSRRRLPWAVVALPATLAAGLALGALWRPGPRPAAPAAPPDEGRVSRLESEVARLRGMVATLEAAAQAPRAPRLNLPLFEILPTSLVRGESAGQANDVLVPVGAREVALLLGSDLPPGTPASLTIRRHDGGEVWRGQGLVSGPPGGYVVVVPVELLADGRYVLALEPRGSAAVAYALRVRRAR